MSSSKFTKVIMSRHAERTLQPLTELTDKMKPSSSNKELIKLSVGDPTLDGNLKPPSVLIDDLVKVVKSQEHNGYPPVNGYDETRDAIAKYWHKFVAPERQNNIRGEGVIVVSGGSHGIVLSITAICNEGDNLLIPNPGFPHYETTCKAYGIEYRPYRCDSEKDWELDFDHIRTLVDSKTKAIVLTNPSNPCGSNFSRKHVEDIVRLCEELKLPIISDEIYAEVVFHGEKFTSVADIDTDIPCVILGGTAKHLVIPGWRVGWAILVDRTNVADAWFDGMDRLAQLHVGANSICQKALTDVITKVPDSYLENLLSVLEAGALAYKPLTKDGFKYSIPRASMFVMLKIDFSRFKDIKDDMDFYEKLLDEENVQVMPGSIFGLPGFFRSTVSRPVGVIQQAVERIQEFCQRHAKASSSYERHATHT